MSWVSAAMDDADRQAARLLDGPGNDGEDGRARGDEGDASEAQAIEGLIRQQLPGQDIRLRLAQVPDDAYALHYAVVSNPFLWFVQHQLYMLPYDPQVDDRLVEAWRDGYRVVNERLALAALEAAGPHRPVVMLQDYHLYLAAATIRRERPDSLLLHFNHIPWPGIEAWQMLPQALRRVILEGLLANDILGFQTDRYAGNFLASVAAFVRDARVDRAARAIRWRGRTIYVRAYPISLDPEALARYAHGPEVVARRDALSERLARAGGPRLIVRVDRLEPSKNVLRGFLAFEALLQRRPDLRDSVRFLAIQSTSRESVPEYARYTTSVLEVIARVNGMADPDDAPIWLLEGSDYARAMAALQLADVVLVNPIVDGMNLVAKESVIVGEPVLILSETAGAAEQLAAEALMVTATDIAGTSRTIERALSMAPGERRARARRLRANVRQQDIAWWLTRQLRDLVALSGGRRPPSRTLGDTLRTFDPALD